ncbi:hypothetical protein [Subtercola endophyticus]|uniref:hypothetical protein n=1 Tax=Subtercola endophyticus TaxID=2895559 RepID=UPI001E5311EE|nr:hypothetical protein [Subtercola endophyticus]UFS58654.1 hypothetical protein LQ955_16910 [Subtercola endophyticus]
MLSENDKYILENRVKPLVTDELLEEQRQRPFGPQSPDMVEVLDFLRRSPDSELPRYIVLETADGFLLGTRVDEPGGSPVLLYPATVYATRGEAEHAVFRLRLKDYGALA